MSPQEIAIYIDQNLPSQAELRMQQLREVLKYLFSNIEGTTLPDNLGYQLKVDISADDNKIQSDALKFTEINGLISPSAGIRTDLNFDSITGTISDIDVYAGESYVIFYTKL